LLHSVQCELVVECVSVCVYVSVCACM